MGKRKVFLLIIVLFALSVGVYAPSLSDKDREHHITLIKIAEKEKLEQEKKEKELERFLSAVAHSESRGNSTAYNRYGYIGKYQFGYTARKSCGYGNVKFKEFVKNPSVWSSEDQEVAMITLLSKNENHLSEIIRRYNGKVIRGVTVTKSGILAAAHLAGAGGVKKYFRYGRNPRDAYGTGLEDYLIKFSGYNF